MSIPDHLIIRYMSLLTSASKPSIQTLQKELDDGKNPRSAKIELAHSLVKQFHDLTAANQAKENFINVFSKKAVPDDIPEVQLSNRTDIDLLGFICDHSLAPSKKEARRLIEQGAVSINNERISDTKYTFHPQNNTIIKVGKRKFIKITV